MEGNLTYLEGILEQLHPGNERLAFHISDKDHSYAALASRVAGIQGLLAEKVPDAHVGLYLADDLETYASILALWLSGKAFVPLNPLFPEERNRSIISQVGLKQVLHSAASCPFEEDLECLRTEGLEGGETLPVLKGFSMEGDAYVLFTSGSTGRPKGVRISFANLDAFVRDFIAYPSYELGPGDRFLQIYDLSFDASVHCYTVPLYLGASVFTVSPDGIKYLAAYRLMQEKELSFVKMPPSTLGYLKSYFPSIKLPHLRYCLFGGEAFPVSLVEGWEACVPHALVQNVYGPTELTINCLIYDWNPPGGKRKQEGGVASIGRTFGSNSALVLNEEGEPAEVGERGELLVTGAQVSPGYWKRPELDREAFLDLEENGRMSRYYRTGDVVVADEQGDLMYLGRNDEQVQVRGYRVELGEIESHAMDFLGGGNVLAFGRSGREGETEICLAVEQDGLDDKALLAYLVNRLPSYMIPVKISALSAFPRLVSGKLDRTSIKSLLEA